MTRGPPQRGSRQEPITWLFEPETFTPLAKLVGDEQLSITCDHLGTPIAMHDATGAEVWSAQLGTWGDLRKQTRGRAQDCPFRWPGQYEDVETGLYYNRFRYYDPEGGQYVSQDPIGLAGGPNLQTYVNDPLASSDPLGLAKCAKGGRDSTTSNVAKTIGARPIVIGENMRDRVIPRARELGADYYRPRGGATLAKQERWINDKMREGRTIIDVGPDPLRAERSPFHELEVAALENRGYPRIIE